MTLPPALIMLGAILLEIRYPRIDPVLLELPGPFDLRWYGLMYVVGFTISYFLLRWMARQDFLRIDPDAIGDLLVWLVLGLIIGARLGYIVFYDAGRLAEDPARIIRIWEGGLSFHGGLAGIIIAGYMFGRKHGIPFLNLADGIVLAAPFGIGAVRVANFINGELFGRVTTEAVPWAMRFPTDPVAIRALGADQARSLREREQIINQAYETSAWEAVRDQVPLRHPSQLYEAFLEGLVLAAILWGILWWMRRSSRRFPDGVFGGIFLIGYGTFRSFVEIFRQPDAQFRGPDDPVGTVLGPLTMGQTLSLLMVLGGIGVLVWLMTRPRPPERKRRRAR